MNINDTVIVKYTNEKYANDGKGRVICSSLVRKMYLSLTWYIPYSATVDENNGYCGMGIITPAGLDETVEFSK